MVWGNYYNKDYGYVEIDTLRKVEGYGELTMRTLSRPLIPRISLVADGVCTSESRGPLASPVRPYLITATVLRVSSLGPHTFRRSLPRSVLTASRGQCNLCPLVCSAVLKLPLAQADLFERCPSLRFSPRVILYGNTWTGSP